MREREKKKGRREIREALYKRNGYKGTGKDGINKMLDVISDNITSENIVKINIDKR